VPTAQKDDDGTGIGLGTSSPVSFNVTFQIHQLQLRDGERTEGESEWIQNRGVSVERLSISHFPEFQN
jgi:hypothetical protein